MKILLTGRNGQVGWELERTLPALGEVLATDRTTLDLADADRTRRGVRDTRPDVIVNAAAYTAVDAAESDSDSAMKVNGEAPGILAEEARRVGALLVHFSTDYVFDGEKVGSYVENDEPRPLSVYGVSKLAGERAIQASGCDHLIIRTSWVYGGRGRNFVLTMLRLAREGRTLRVVDDQFGAPTSSMAVAEATVLGVSKAMEDRALCGLYHATTQGSTSWFGFARAILASCGKQVAIHPISSAEYSARAQRPRNSILDSGKLAARLGVKLPSWQEDMARILSRIAHE